MVGVGIVAPTHEERFGADVFKAAEDLRDSLFRPWAFAWNEAIREPQKSDVLRIEAEFLGRL